MNAAADALEAVIGTQDIAAGVQKCRKALDDAAAKYGL